MATEITQTNELYLELADPTGEYTRILRIANPKSSLVSGTKEQINAIIAPTFFPSVQSSSSGDTAIEPFFFDDYDKTKGLTQLKSVQVVQIRKEVTSIE